MQIELHKQEEYSIDFIESIIKNQIEESINIEFKAAEALAMTDNKKKELSKDVSAFANSNGGIIIYGINEIDHKANSISFIDGNAFTKEWLEQIINSCIYRTIPNLRIFPIRKNGDIKKTIYVVQIPESTEAPHMAKDKRFYRRYNFESVFMDEYEIRNLYFKRSKSKLEIDTYHVLVESQTKTEIQFTIEVDIKNIGTTYANEYKINVYFENIETSSLVIYNAGINKQHVEVTRSYKRMHVSAEPRKSIYPDESLNVIRFDFKVDKNELQTFCYNTKLRIHLLFPYGEDSVAFDMIDDYKEKLQYECIN